MTMSKTADGALLRPAKPSTTPARPYFSSGPCAKPPGWDASKLQTESLGRSHRAKIGKSRLQLAIDLMRDVLQVPATHRIGIVPGSDTGAIEMAMWTMLGARPVTMMAWESFGEGWVTDVNKQLKLNANVMNAAYGEIPDLERSRFFARCRFHLERHDIGRTRSRWRLDQRYKRGPDLQRCDQRGFCL